MLLEFCPLIAGQLPPLPLIRILKKRITFEDNTKAENSSTLKIKVKQFPYRPGQGVEAPRVQDNRHTKVLTLSTLPPRKYSWYSFLLEGEPHQGHSTPGRIVSLKNSNDKSGIEPETFRLVAQCLNQLRHRVPPSTLNMAS